MFASKKSIFKISKVCLIILFSGLFLHGQTVDDIIQKNIDARGGVENWQAVNSIKIIGAYTAFSLTHPFTITKKRPNLYRFDHTLSSKSVIQAFDGKTAWQIHPFYGSENPMKIPNDDSLIVIRDMPIESPFLNYGEKGHSVALLGDADMDGIACYQLKLVLKDSTEEVWYIDKSSYLEVKMEGTSYDFGQKTTLETYFEDYREVGGIKLPFLTELEYRTRHRVYQLETVEVNPVVDEAIFKMPIVKTEEKTSEGE